MRISLCVVVSLLLASVWSATAFAQEAAEAPAAAESEAAEAEVAGAESPNPATVEPVDDPRWKLMGEFAGEVTIDGNSQRYGLQLRPLGELDFQGQLYKGGLPGEDDFDKDGTRVVGLHSKDFVAISGGPAAIIGRPDFCLFLDPDGNRLGTLNRVWRESPTLGAKPPKNAIVLFDGTNTDQFDGAKVTPEGLLMQGAKVAPMVQDFHLHAEYKLPYQPERDGQQRGNSGFYLLSRYEVQVLDSFGLPPVFNGCGSLYRTREPDLNMCFPPLRWQTYDITFTSPRWLADGTKRRNAHITVVHNGVKIHDNFELKNKTGAGKQEAPSLLPILIQDHTEPVRFRNIWMIDRGLAVESDVFPPMSEDSQG